MEKILFSQLPDGYNFTVENKLDWDTLFRKLNDHQAEILCSSNKELEGRIIEVRMDKVIYL